MCSAPKPRRRWLTKQMALREMMIILKEMRDEIRSIVEFNEYDEESVMLMRCRLHLIHTGTVELLKIMMSVVERQHPV